MEQRLKQRLLGTAVLVALAVIIVPEVVKTSGPIAPPAVATSIPPRPEPPQSAGVTVALPPAIVPPPVRTEPPLVQQPVPTIVQSPLAEPPHAPARLPSATPDGDGPQGMRTVDLAAGAPRAAPAAPAPSVSKPSAPRPQSAPAPVTASAPKPAPAPSAVASTSRPVPEPTRTPAESPRPKPSVEPVAKTATPATTPVATARPVSLPKIELTSRDSGKPSASPPVSGPWRPQASAGSWAVQVGSFGVEENANLLRDRLRSQRFPAVVERIRSGGQPMYRVRVVGQDSRPASEAVATRLRSAGVAANIVEPGD